MQLKDNCAMIYKLPYLCPILLLALCKPGFFSANGLESCNACPRNTYVDFYGANECITCPNNLGTVVTAATDLYLCDGEQT